jgi:hypothetical protein
VQRTVTHTYIGNYGHVEVVPVTVRCPANTVELGGGVLPPRFAPYPAFASARAMRRLDAVTWRAAIEIGGQRYDTKVTLTAFAYCGPGRAPKAVSRKLTVPPQGTGSTTVACPDGTALAFGGYIARPSTAAYDLEALSNTAWRVSARNFGAAAQTVIALGYCR